MIEMLPAMQTTRVRTVDFMQPSTDQPQALAPAFAVKNLSMWYGAKEAIKNVTIDIPAKRVTAIIGPSGCGKSTFLRCLNRLHELVPRARVEGEVLFAGANLYAPNIDPAVIRRSIGMVFQKSNPFPTMSIADNVLVGLKLNGVRDRKLLNERLEKSLRMAALWSEVICGSPASVFQADNSSAFALRARSRLSPKCCSWMSQPPRLIRSRR